MTTRSGMPSISRAKPFDPFANNAPPFRCSFPAEGLLAYKGYLGREVRALGRLGLRDDSRFPGPASQLLLLESLLLGHGDSCECLQRLETLPASSLPEKRNVR